MKNKKLSLTESVLLVAGAGMGTGLLTLPYAVSKIGLFGTLVALGLAYTVSLGLYFVIADLCRNSESSEDLSAILDEHLFKSGKRRVLRTVFYVLMCLLLVENLAVYTLCAAQVISDTFSVGIPFACAVFFTVCSLAAAFGVRGLGTGETLSVSLIGAAVVFLTVLSLFRPKGAVSFSFGDPGKVFAVYGLFMFAFSAIFSVMQVCVYIKDREKTGKAVAGGLSLNAVLTVVFILSALKGSENVTPVATTGLALSVGSRAVELVCTVLVLAAMFSSFLSSGFAFSDVIRKTVRVKGYAAWLASTLPAVVCAAFLPVSVTDLLQIGAGVLSLILMSAVLPAFLDAARSPSEKLLTGRGNTPRYIALSVGIGMILMAVSSFIPID